jgi:outer membrane protein assembly factor BamB
MRRAKTAAVLAGCVLLVSAACARAQDWPQWRGPNRDNKVIGFAEPKTWPKELTKKWSVKVGLGDASPVLVGDKIFVFTRESTEEVVRCLDAVTGDEKWKDKYETDAVTGPGGGHPGPRSAPAAADGKVCTFGVAGVLSCYDSDKGKLLWRKETKAHPQFFTSVSPIIVDGKCIAYIGGRGKGELVAYDLANGDEKWKWSGDGPAYGSPVLVTADKTKQLVTPTEKEVVGIDAVDGKLLWKASYQARYNSATPVADGPTIICSGPPDMRGGGKGGTTAFKIEKKDDGFDAKETWTQPKTFAGIYNTPVLKDGLLYGLTSAGGGGGRGMGQGPTNIFCMKADSGDVLWTDPTKRGQCGEIFDAGSVLLALTSDRELLVFKPSDKKYEELAKYNVADTETWAYPIIAGNRVFVKDKDSLTLWLIE